MVTIWRGSWCMCMLLLLVSCSSKQSAQTLHAPNPQAIEQLYQDGRVAFKERRYDDAVKSCARSIVKELVGQRWRTHCEL